MGSGGSGVKGGGKGGSAPAPANTPSGISFDTFSKMSDSEKISTLTNIINDDTINVPDYLDKSDTTKVIYALGMNNKPTVVSDSQLDSLPGRELFRCVYDNGNPPIKSTDILDQITYGDYTQLSGKGGSVHGRALYMGTSFSSAATYGTRGSNPVVMRSKINPNAKIRSEDSLKSQMRNDSAWQSAHWKLNSGSYDDIALYALSHGVDAWYSSSYTMIVNRGILSTSSTKKSAGTPTKTGRARKKISYGTLASSWGSAADVKS